MQPALYIRLPLRSLFLISFCALLVIGPFAWSSFAQQRKIDSMLHILKSGKRDTVRSNTLNSLAWRLRSRNPDTSIVLSLEALQLSRKLQFPRGEMKALHNLGSFYELKGNYALSLDYNQKALKLTEEMKNLEGIAVSLGNIGIVYDAQGDYPRALAFYLKALRIAEQMSSSPDSLQAKRGNQKMAVHSVNIGNLYQNQGDYDGAIALFLKALEYQRKGGISRHTSTILGNVGTVYYLKKEYERALDYLLQAVEKSEQEMDKAGVARHLINMGNVYSEQGDYKKALECCKRSLTISEELGSKATIAAVLGNMGGIYMKLNDLDRAEEQLKRSLEMTRAIGELTYTMEFEKSLSDLYGKKGNYRLAMEHYRAYIAARDSISNEENTKKTVQVQMQYEFDKQQAADSIRNAEQLKQEALKHGQEIAQQRVYTYGGAIGFVLMLVVAFVSFRAYRQKQKANEIISKQKLLVEAKQKEVLDSIYYARRIQQSLLPTSRYIERSLHKLRKG